MMPISHEIVFTGRSNVGKSSLIKRLTGKNVRTGRRPGVTRKPTHITSGGVLMTDLPGYGFLHGVHSDLQERIKDQIVRYLEDNCDRILCAVQVIDARAFCEIVDRWGGRGEIPVDIELFEFLHDLEIDTIIAVNKMDLVGVDDRDHALDEIAERFDLLPPWKQWIDTIAPVSAKRGDISSLVTLLHAKSRG